MTKKVIENGLESNYCGGHRNILGGEWGKKFGVENEKISGAETFLG